MGIERVGDEYVAWDEGGYLPGTYATRQAAERAIQVAKVHFEVLEILASQGRPVVLDDLALLQAPSDSM